MNDNNEVKTRKKLLKKEQSIITDQSDDLEFFEANYQPNHNCDVHISIPVNGLEIDKLFEAERLLAEAGVTFDTGYGGGCRDWEFDWSLRGAYVMKRRDLTIQEQRANMVDRILSDRVPCKVLADIKYDSPFYICVTVYGSKRKLGTILREILISNGAKQYKNCFSLGDTIIEIGFTR